jgi:hypothetical protein
LLTFQPPELQGELDAAFRLVEEKLGISSEYLINEDTFDPSAPDFDPSEYEDQTITRDSSAFIELYRSETAREVTYGELIEFLGEFLTATLDSNHLECDTNSRMLRRVDVKSAPSIVTLWEERANFEGNMFGMKLDAGGVPVTCALASGTTMFGAMILACGDYDKYFPPVLPEDFFIEIRHKGLPTQTVSRIADAYAFELSASLGVDLVPNPRPIMAEVVYKDDEDDEDDEPLAPDWISSPRLRPLVTDESSTDLLRLYNDALRVDDASMAVLSFQQGAGICVADCRASTAQSGNWHEAERSGRFGA